MFEELKDDDGIVGHTLQRLEDLNAATARLHRVICIIPPLLLGHPLRTAWHCIPRREHRRS